MLQGGRSGAAWMPATSAGMTLLWPIMREINYGHFTSGGMDERIESTLPPVFNPKIVPRS